MSRFSKAEAEARGWVFVHEREGYEVLESATQGRTRSTPPTIRAEKYVSLPGQPSVLVHEEAETMGKLLERIHAYEEQIERNRFIEPDEPFVAEPSADGPLNDAGLPLRSVIVAAEREDLSLDVETRQLTEEEFAARDRTDVLIVADGDSTKQVFRGGANDDVQKAIDVNDQHTHNIENRRAAEKVVGSRKQVEVDPGTLVDSPNTTGTGTLIVREDEESGQDVADRKQALKSQAEDARVNAQIAQGFSTPHAPEGAEALAGVDVGIQERGDLGSETPPVGAVPGNTEFGPAAEVARERHDEIEADKDDVQSEADVRSEAEEEKAKELRDEDLSKADTGEAAQEVREAGIEAAHDHDPAEVPPDGGDHDSEPGDQFTEKDDVEATDAAKEAAKELNVDLDEVKGSGKDGRVTKPDVEKAAEQE